MMKFSLKPITFGLLFGIILSFALYDVASLFYHGLGFGIAWSYNEALLMQRLFLGFLVGGISLYAIFEKANSLWFWIVGFITYLALSAISYSMGKDLEGWPIAFTGVMQAIPLFVIPSVLRVGLVSVLYFGVRKMKVFIVRPKATREA